LSILALRRPEAIKRESSLSRNSADTPKA
jgi:hypothetical protein